METTQIIRADQTAPVTVYDNMPDPMGAIERMGEMFAASGMFGCEKAEQGMVLAMACMAEKRSPFEIMKTYHIVKGRLSMRADAMQARFQQVGGIIEWAQYDGQLAAAYVTYGPNVRLQMSYSIQEAQQAGLVRNGSGWTKHPDAMLRARLISRIVRMLAPEVVAGTYTPEEVSDFDDSPVPTAQPAASADLLAAAAPAPAQTPPPAPQVVPPPANALPTLSPNEEIAALERELANDSPAAIAWLLSQGWLTQGQTIADLTAGRRQQILSNTDRFLATIRKAA